MYVRTWQWRSRCFIFAVPIHLSVYPSTYDHRHRDRNPTACISQCSLLQHPLSQGGGGGHFPKEILLTLVTPTLNEQHAAHSPSSLTCIHL
ncbi:hypothetical protein B0T17DRAFT_654139 [Bombardia bombarda]|uniref:Uncharacterized protein n=1 Tax=Bombardia bombarda TaxID=252184 RepID=A0AA39XBB3_9PEZI|nr:hypothetical protein B0T17DRAFT_654139 [Bombardia bombarda]